MGIPEAEHEESAPDAPLLFISKLACSLVGEIQTIKLAADSEAQRAYGQEEVKEQFFCNYGFNPIFRGTLGKDRLKISGVDLEGAVRIIELSDHPFYLATLFLPQISSSPGNPHPLIVAYLRAALAFQSSRPFI